MNDTILITGGAGFLAQHLVREIQTKCFQDVEEIRLFDLVPYEPIFDFPTNVPIVQIMGDCTNKNDIQSALKDVSVVYHLCAEKYCYDMFDDREKQWRNNVTATETVLAAATEQNVSIFVNVSHALAHVSWSESVLMPAEIGTLKEPASYLLGHHGESKFKAEKLVSEHNGKLLKNGSKMLTASIRATFLYGEGGGWLLPYSLELAGRIGGTIPQLSDRDEKMQLTYAGNCASMLTKTVECLRKDPATIGGEVFFCNDGNGLSIYNYFDYITPFLEAAQFKVTKQQVFSYQFSVLSSIFLENIFGLIHKALGLRIGHLPNSRVVSLVSNLQFTFSSTKARLLMQWKAPYDHKASMAKFVTWWTEKIRRESILNQKEPSC